MKRSLLILVVLICIPVTLYLGLTFIGVARKDARVARAGAFFQIGKKVVSYIQDGQPIPKNLSELKAASWLSEEEMRFLEKNNITYIPPGPDSSQDEVILRMPYEGGLDLIVEKNGYMRKDHRRAGY